MLADRSVGVESIPKKGSCAGFFLNTLSTFITRFADVTIVTSANCLPGCSNQPTPHTHSVGGSITVNAKTTVCCSPDSSMVLPKQERKPTRMVPSFKLAPVS
jgi:hypothetical protein